jgi:hypothetical protein
MLTSIRCVNYRGFEDFKVSGLGRVNLVIGTNNSGKSSWLGAAFSGGRTFHVLREPLVRSSTVNLSDRSRWWRPLFRHGDEARGLQIEVEEDGVTVSMRAVAVQEKNATVRGPQAWWYELHLSEAPGPPFLFREEGDSIYFDRPFPKYPRAGWSSGQGTLTTWDLEQLTALASDGRLDEISEPLRRFDPRLEGIELIGTQVMVKLRGLQRRLPVEVLGDGAFRLLDLSICLTDHTAAHICSDELDTGVHHTALPQLWQLLQRARPGLQLFATTHRDECVLAAARTFLEAGDDGLRVIRLDRTEAGHSYAMYTAEQARYAIESGWEIRG